MASTPTAPLIASVNGRSNSKGNYAVKQTLSDGQQPPAPEKKKMSGTVKIIILVLIVLALVGLFLGLWLGGVFKSKSSTPAPVVVAVPIAGTSTSTTNTTTPTTPPPPPSNPPLTTQTKAALKPATQSKPAVQTPQNPPATIPPSQNPPAMSPPPPPQNPPAPPPPPSQPLTGTPPSDLIIQRCAILNTNGATYHMDVKTSETPPSGYTPDGVRFAVWSVKADPNMVPIYRLSAGPVLHMLTRDEGEIAASKAWGWSVDLSGAPMFYAYPPSATLPGLIPVYRMQANQDHMTSSNANEPNYRIDPTAGVNIPCLFQCTSPVGTSRIWM